MNKNIKKIVSMVAAFTIVAAMGLGAFSYFTDYATSTSDAVAGTFDIDLAHDIDLDGDLGILNPGDVHAFDFIVSNEAEKSADVYAVVTVTGTRAVGATAKTASPYKLLVNGSAAKFEDSAEVAKVVKSGNADGKQDYTTYVYTLPVNELSGSIEEITGKADSYKYEYEIGMDIDALNEWEGSKVDVKIEIFAKQHENTDHVTDSFETANGAWETAVRAEIGDAENDPTDTNAAAKTWQKGAKNP